MATVNTLLKIALLALIMMLSAGCATTQQAEGVNDPLEGYNRAMFAANGMLDTVILKPVTVVYDTILPPPINQGITNFFSNLNEISVIFNDLAQFKFQQAWEDTGRFLLNSTVGVAGIFDIAGMAGLEKHHEDFGQTLAVWGVESGPYLILPIFGPSSTRDVFRFATYAYTDPVGHINDVPTRNRLWGLNFVDHRAALLSADKVLEEAALDKYVYVREAYLQYRMNLVHDGEPPETAEDAEFDVFED